MNDEIVFKYGDIAILDDIKELWEEQNAHHFKKSIYFKHHYENNTFQKRKDQIINAAKNGKIFVTIAYDKDEKIGYIVSRISDDTGEIESIYVKEDYRRHNIGNALMEESMNFLKSNNVKKIVLRVAHGNEEVLGFYKKFGFYPRATELQSI